MLHMNACKNIKKLAGKDSFSLMYVFILLSGFILSSCGGGGGGGGAGAGVTVFALDGGPVTGASSELSVALYSFEVVAGTPYTISLVDDSTVTALYVYTADPLANPSTPPIGISWTDGAYESVSFIANTTGTIYALPLVVSFSGTTSYTIQATTNHLTVDAPAKTATVYGDGGIFSSDLFYSFTAQAGTAYEVRVTPTQGNVDIARVTPNTNMSGSVGSSSNSGSSTDSVFFTASATQTYYVRVDGTATDTIFDISVHEVPPGFDLRVEIDSAVSDTNNVIVNYTVYNDGATAYSGDVQVDVWAALSSQPLVGSTGDDFVSHTAVNISELGGTISGTVTIANTAESGSAYAVVDTIEAIVEGNENDNVSAVASWQKPMLAPVDFDFEDGLISPKVMLSGDSNWFVDNANGANGSFRSLRSGSIGDNGNSCFSISVYNSKSTNISFDVNVSSEVFDKLFFYIDGTETSNWSDMSAWSHASHDVSAGLHIYKWCYTKDFADFNAGTDQAWIDNISIASIPADLKVFVTNAIWDGTNVILDYTVTNYTSVPTTDFAVDFWSGVTAAPVLGDTGETSVNHSGLAANSLVTGTVTIANRILTTSDRAYAIVDTTDVIPEYDDVSNNVSSETSFTYRIPDVRLTVTSVWSDGSDVTVNYTLSNNTFNDAGAFEVDVWSDAASIPVTGDAGETSVAYAGLAGSTSINGSVTIANASASGTAYVIVDTSDALSETDETNNTHAGVPWIISPAASVSYDFEDSVVPNTFLMSGNADWVIDSNGVGNGQTKGIRSAAIGESETSCMAIQVFDSSSISFYLNVSTYAGDRLYFYIDGIVKNSWMVNEAWQNFTSTVAIGMHEYKWCYIKDASVGGAGTPADAVWIDNIVIN